MGKGETFLTYIKGCHAKPGQRIGQRLRKLLNSTVVFSNEEEGAT